jgi:hypothetical protein
MKKYIIGKALPRAVGITAFVVAYWLFRALDFSNFLIVR